MTTDQFWKLIEDSKDAADGDVDEQMDALRGKLDELDACELVDFDRIFNEQMSRSYHWDLWGAAYIINGGCSDDGFEYFRGWLIAQGQSTFDAALKNPESLAEAAEADVECEDILGIAVDAYQDKFGEELPRVNVPERFELKGEQWREADLDKKFPKLTQRFST